MDPIQFVTAIRLRTIDPLEYFASRRNFTRFGQTMAGTRYVTSPAKTGMTR